MPNIEVVTPLHRNANTRAVQERAKWRARYNDIAKAIRQTKSRIRSNPADTVARIQLEALRFWANDLLIARDEIGYDLRATSYPYADKQDVIAAQTKA